MKNDVRSPFYLGICLALMGLCLMLASCTGAAYGGQVVCRAVVKQQAVVQQVVATPVYYQVGAHLQGEAVATQGFRQSDEYQDYLRLQGYVQRVQEERVQLPSTSEPTPAELPAPPDPGPEPEPAEKYPTIAAKCASCHHGETPKGDVWLDGSVTLAGSDAAAKRDAIVRVMIQGLMPKNGQLTPEEFGAILAELYQDE